MRTSVEESYDSELIDVPEIRHINDIIEDIRGHLTKDELLCVSLFKNSRRRSNNIYRIFINKYHNKMLTTTAISMRKQRMLKVLNHVGALLKYKKNNNVDIYLRNILTTRQFQILNLYERRKTNSIITQMLNIQERAIEKCYKRCLLKMEESEEPVVQRYLELLRNVLKFSRKSTHYDEKKPL